MLSCPRPGPKNSDARGVRGRTGHIESGMWLASPQRARATTPEARRVWTASHLPAIAGRRRPEGSNTRRGISLGKDPRGDECAHHEIAVAGTRLGNPSREPANSGLVLFVSALIEVSVAAHRPSRWSGRGRSGARWPEVTRRPLDAISGQPGSGHAGRARAWKMCSDWAQAWASRSPRRRSKRQMTSVRLPGSTLATNRVTADRTR